MSVNILGPPTPSQNLERLGSKETKKLKTTALENGVKPKHRQALGNLSNTVNQKTKSVMKTHARSIGKKGFDSKLPFLDENEDIEYMPPSLSNKDDDQFQPPLYINELVSVVSKPLPLVQLQHTNNFKEETFDTHTRSFIFPSTFQNSNYNLEDLMIDLPFDLPDLPDL